MTTFNWYLNGFNKGYWPSDKQFDATDPHNQYSKDFRQGLTDGETAGKKALDKIAKQNYEQNKAFEVGLSTLNLIFGRVK